MIMNKGVNELNSTTAFLEGCKNYFGMVPGDDEMAETMVEMARSYGVNQTRGVIPQPQPRSIMHVASSSNKMENIRIYPRFRLFDTDDIVVEDPRLMPSRNIVVVKTETSKCMLKLEDLVLQKHLQSILNPTYRQLYQNAYEFFDRDFPPPLVISPNVFRPVPEPINELEEMDDDEEMYGSDESMD